MKKKIQKKIKSADSLEIARLRNEAGLDQPALAELLDRGIKTISNWENAEKPLKSGTVAYVAQICREYAETTRRSKEIKDKDRPSETASQEDGNTAHNVVESPPSTKEQEVTSMSQKDQLIDFLNQQVRGLEAEIAVLKQTKDSKPSKQSG